MHEKERNEIKVGSKRVKVGRYSACPSLKVSFMHAGKFINSIPRGLKSNVV